MITRSLLLSLYCGLIVYLIMNLFWGNQGITALKELEIERVVLERNLDDLTRENEYWQIHLDQLKNDRKSISILARRMGYIEKNERIIYSTLNNGESSDHLDLPLLRTGSVDISSRKGHFFRILSFMIILLVFILILIIEWGQRGIRRPFLS